LAEVERPRVAESTFGAPSRGKETREMQLRNATEYEFTDISSEVCREYEFPGGHVVLIESPLFLSVAPSGGHRVLDAAGMSHYVPTGWLHLSWVAKDGQPHFVK